MCDNNIWCNLPRLPKCILACHVNRANEIFYNGWCNRIKSSCWFIIQEHLLSNAYNWDYLVNHAVNIFLKYYLFPIRLKPRGNHCNIKICQWKRKKICKTTAAWFFIKNKKWLYRVFMWHHEESKKQLKQTASLYIKLFHQGVPETNSMRRHWAHHILPSTCF